MDRVRDNQPAASFVPKRNRVVPGLCIAAIAALHLAWGWVEVRGRAAPATAREGQKTDLVVYLAAASALRAGQDIYESQNVRSWPYLYPPLAALVFVPLVDLPRNQAAFLWFLASLGCLAGSILAIRAALRCIDARWADRATLLGLLVVTLPILHTLQRGQINALPLLLVCLAFYAVVRRCSLLAGICLAMATAIKVTPGLAAGYFVWKWLEHQIRTIRAGTWRPHTLLERTRAPLGFALGVLLGLLVIPGLYMGPRQAVAAVGAWHAKVAAGYMTSDPAGQAFRETRGIHDTSNRNQTWYRVALSSAYLYDHTALAGRDQVHPDWQSRLWWLLLGTGALLAGIFAWASGDNGSQPDPAATFASLAAFVWLAISFGKIAWPHFYVMIYPLSAVAWLLARQHAGTRDGRALAWISRLMVVACLVHYGYSGTDDLSEPIRTRAQRTAQRTQVSGPRDLGGLLLPAGVLALATAVLANRRPRPVDCGQTSATGASCVGLP